MLAQARTVHPADAAAMSESQFASVGCTVSGRAAFVKMQNDFQAVQLQIAREIQQLIKDSRINNSPIYLTKHIVRGKQDYLSLRWRRRFADTSHHHVIWFELYEVLNGMPPVMRQHYEALNRRAKELNTLAQIVKHSMVCISDHLKQLSASGGCKPLPSLQLEQP